MAEQCTSSNANKVTGNEANEVAEFKKPASVTHKHRPKILCEEKYVEVMADIIQRDFFPHLEILRAQNEYLDAESDCDFSKMAELRAKYAGQFTPRSSARSQIAPDLTPTSFETPPSRHGDSNSPQPSDFGEGPKAANSKSETSSVIKSAPSICGSMSLDTFLHRYTSEDNKSFEDIIETAEAKLRERYAVLYKHEKLSIEKLQNALKLPDATKQLTAGGSAIRQLDTWEYKNLNAIMFMPDGEAARSRELAEADKPVIKHSATRLDWQSSKGGHAAFAVAESDAAELSKATEPTEGKTPRIGGFDLIGMPSPRPGIDESPLMTWGEIEGTPFRLDGGDTPRPGYAGGVGFSIAANSRREDIALELADKVGVKMRAQKQAAANAARRNINSPLIRSNIDRLTNMSPAAQRLATTRLGIGAASPYMKTPTLSPFGTPRRDKCTIVKTHRNLSGRAKSGGHGTSSSNPPSRNRAADFF